jgi:hypothetical protein
MYENLFDEFSSLPIEAQRQVADFIAFLRQRYQSDANTRRTVTQRLDLSDEPFIGMWRDREEMQDSATWVRKTRQQEWTKRRG